MSTLVSLPDTPFELHLQLGPKALWTYQPKGLSVQKIKPPTVEIDGKPLTLAVSAWNIPRVERLRDGLSEVTAVGQVSNDIELLARFRLSESPIVRFQYELRGSGKFTKTSGNDNLVYGSTQFSSTGQTKEIRLAEYLEPTHTYTLDERELNVRDFSLSNSFMGPILVSHHDGQSQLLAYEHGSQVPDAFVELALNAQGQVSIQALKGNYVSGSTINGYSTIWLEYGSVAGDLDTLAATYRKFVLHHMAVNNASRQPHVYYNTWNMQERDYYWRHGSYYDHMNEDFVLADIEAAHQMGIDTYVLDVCWFEKTGDWVLNSKYFPNGIKPVKELLDKYKMHLGIWFEPKSAAVSSQVLQGHESCIMSWEGKQFEPEVVWRTEASHQLCLASGWADTFADKLIERAQTYGITYFKWDAISQYGCDAATHDHGTDTNSAYERADCYAFQLGRAMVHVVERLTTAIPEAIVDFDVTEGSRFVGLGFLAVGKYFLINNGPSQVTYDMPVPPHYSLEDKTSPLNTNITFYKGPARTWICRSSLDYDKWIPSILFLVHYYPDDSYPTLYDKHAQLDRYRQGRVDKTPVDVGADNQRVNIGSLILGHNGIWGDLQLVSSKGVQRIRDHLDRYKQVRQAVTEASPIREGKVGGNPEIHEKIDDTGRGAVVIFSSSFGKPYSAKIVGTYTYVTKRPVVSKWWHDGQDTRVEVVNGHAVITVTFHNASAKIVYFGAE